MVVNKINEDLNRFKKLLGYDPSKGDTITEKVQPWRYSLNEAEPGEEEDEDENADFDFGGDGNPEDEKDTEEGGFDFGSEEGDDTEEVDTEEGENTEDEFGTADEFSASDELDDEDGDVEEIDVTDIVKKSDEATEFAKQALTVGQENGEFLKSLTDKLSNLEAQLSKMDTIASKITKLEQDVKTPEEKLELRSLDSYPFNMKLTDYWNEKASKNKHYDITGGESNIDGEEKEYRLTQKDIDDYNDVDIKKSFVPESRNRKRRM